MRVSTHLQKGKQAELRANQYLQAKGLQLLEQNYRCYHGEIDLIMQNQDDIVFIEVRSRNRIDFGNAIETINQNKIKKLITTATYFLQMKKWLNKRNSRFDIVVFHPYKGKVQLEWIKSAFTVERF